MNDGSTQCAWPRRHQPNHNKSRCTRVSRPARVVVPLHTRIACPERPRQPYDEAADRPMTRVKPNCKAINCSQPWRSSFVWCLRRTFGSNSLGKLGIGPHASMISRDPARLCCLRLYLKKPRYTCIAGVPVCMHDIVYPDSCRSRELQFYPLFRPRRGHWPCVLGWAARTECATKSHPTPTLTYRPCLILMKPSLRNNNWR